MIILLLYWSPVGVGNNVPVVTMCKMGQAEVDYFFIVCYVITNSKI